MAVYDKPMKDQKLEEFDRLLTVKEVASILNISENTVKFWVSRGKFDVVRVGRLVRVSAKALREWIEENTVKRKKNPASEIPRSLKSRKSNSFNHFIDNLKDEKSN